MAKTATKTRTIVRTIPAPTPIIRYRERSRPKKHHRGRGRGQSSQKLLMGMLLGGFAMGFIDKQGTSLPIPTLPVLGRAGTIAAVAHFLGKGKPGIVTDVRNAAAAIAAYEYGSTGKVSGDDASAV